MVEKIVLNVYPTPGQIDVSVIEGTPTLISFTSDPDPVDAIQVKVDGSDAGDVLDASNNPFTVNLAAGDHTVTVTAEGVESNAITVHVQPRPAELDGKEFTYNGVDYQIRRK